MITRCAQGPGDHPLHFSTVLQRSSMTTLPYPLRSGYHTMARCTFCSYTISPSRLCFLALSLVAGSLSACLSFTLSGVWLRWRPFGVGQHSQCKLLMMMMMLPTYPSKLDSWHNRCTLKLLVSFAGACTFSPPSMGADVFLLCAMLVGFHFNPKSPSPLLAVQAPALVPKAVSAVAACSVDTW